MIMIAVPVVWSGVAQQAQMVAAPTGAWDGAAILALRVLLCIGGATFAGASLWVLRGRRADHAERVDAKRQELAKLGSLTPASIKNSANQATSLPEGEAHQGMRAAMRAMSEPTRLLVGISLLIAGYHMLAYGLPPGAMPFRVPPERLWMLGVGLVGACVMSVWVDRWIESDAA